jgi:hypothetical protein
MIFENTFVEIRGDGPTKSFILDQMNVDAFVKREIVPR